MTAMAMNLNDLTIPYYPNNLKSLYSLLMKNFLMMKTIF